MRLPEKLLLTNLCKPAFRYGTLLSFIFSIYFAHSNHGFDELEKQLLGMPDDTAKVNVLLELGEQYCSIENDKSLMFLQEAFTISTAHNYTDGIGRSLLWQGRVYYYKDDYPLSLKYLEKAKTKLEASNNLDDLAFLHFVKGEIFRIKGDFINALQSYHEALKFAENTKNERYISTFYGSLGMVHLERKEPEKAMAYFKKSLILKNQIDDLSGISNVYTCIGKAYEEISQLDSSLWYYQQALDIRLKQNNVRAIAGSEYNKGGILIKLGKYQEAEKSLTSAFLNFNSLEEKTGMIITNFRLAIARNMQGLPDAVDIAESALEMAKKIDNPNLISHGYKILSDIYYFNKTYKIAFDYLKKHKALQDSLFNTDKERILTEFEEKFQSEQKDRELEEYRTKNKIQNQNIILLAVLLVAAIGFVLLLFFLFRIKSTTLKRKEQLLEQEAIIHEQENKLAEKENQILQEQLEVKNRALASKALEMIRLNDTISNIIEKLETIKQTNNNNPEVYKHIKEIINELETQTKQNIWNEFNKIFKNIHSDFYSKLLSICPDLSPTEIKTAALLRLNLTTKEIAAIAFKSEGGVKTTRYRLRKKLNLGSDEKLIPFLMQI